jgi:hypothetical protein
MSVMLLDCSRLDWDIEQIIGDLDAGKYTYAELLFDMCLVEPDEIADDIPPEWNHLEHYEPGVTKLVHYTVVPTQPWKNDKNPLADLWTPAFEEAKAAGLVRLDEVDRLARKGHIKRSLAGLKPRGKGTAAIYAGLGLLQRLVSRAENRWPMLRHPTLIRLRNRVARFVGA